MSKRVILLGVAALTLLLAACSSGSSKVVASTPTTVSGSTATTPGGGTVHVAKPAADEPSESAQMICKEAVKDIDEVLGVKATVSAPTWIDHTYSCNYEYPKGAVMKMSVKELSSADETTAYYDSLAQKLGKKQDLQGLGQGAFEATDGSVVTRKDYKVLTTDVSKLPAQFGDPADTRANDAINVSYTIMGCWTGA